MAYATQSAYRDSEVLNASPERLVQIVYDVAARSIASARLCLETKDIQGRVRHVNTAFSALVELTSGLDFEAGKEIAQNYANIYDYCQRRLIEGHVRQDDAILAEAQSLIGDLQEAWQIVVTRVSTECAARFTAEGHIGSRFAGDERLSVVG
jgi:flagellar secretion chaperone FliS